MLVGLHCVVMCLDLVLHLLGFAQVVETGKVTERDKLYPGLEKSLNSEFCVRNVMNVI